MTRSHYPLSRVLDAALAECGMDRSAFVLLPKNARGTEVRRKVACAMRELTISSYTEIAVSMGLANHTTACDQYHKGMKNGGAEFVECVRARLEKQCN